METGELDDARRAAARAVDLISGLGDSRVAAMARVRLAATCREMGDPAAGIKTVLGEAGGWELTRIQPGWRVPYAEAMTRVELAAGQVDDAERFAICAECVSKELSLPLTTAIAKRARAAVLLTLEEAAMATDMAMASADAASAVGARIEAARSQALAGRARAMAGDRTTAVHLLRSAEKTFDACGARRDRGEARHELRRLRARVEPRGPSTQADTGLASLSRREVEIAELVTARKTNKEVAAELFLSEKTIESHLRNIFVKLGVSSRVEVARAVERTSTRETLR
jgi:DNA-binding NarL/FixJ family response regulator